MPAKLPPGVAAERRRRRQRQWEIANRAKRRAYNTAQRKKNAVAYKAQRHRWYTSATVNMERRAGMLIRSAKERAKKRQVPFDLEVKDILLALELGICQATGLPFSMDRGSGRSPFGPSLDRIELSKGYVRGNVRVVVWALNAACGTWGEDVLMQIVDARRKQIAQQGGIS